MLNYLILSLIYDQYVFKTVCIKLDTAGINGNLSAFHRSYIIKTLVGGDMSFTCHICCIQCVLVKK